MEKNEKTFGEGPCKRFSVPWGKGLEASLDLWWKVFDAFAHALKI